MTEVELLKAARAKVEQGWCQGVYAKDKNGGMVSYLDENACAFCIRGALIVSGLDGDCDTPAFTAAQRRLLRRMPSGVSIPEYNDTPGRTKDDVLGTFDRAIKDAEAGVWIS